jgi:NodT family efflux transporter outer membrane factor (OMF) lipoprotein
VGPEYCPPCAHVAKHWIDEADLRTAPNPNTLACWWTVFDDPKLNELIACAYRQNLTLREAGFRILQARAQRAIAVGNLFPQQQFANGSFTRNAAAINDNNAFAPLISRFSDSWDFGFNLNWELDLWGRYRRAVAAADANLDASVADYDDVMVTLLADVAASYVTVRTTQERIKLLRQNTGFQQGVYDYTRHRATHGVLTTLDADQALSTLRQTEAAIPQLEITQRQAENSLCILMGMPPADLARFLATGPIPTTPPDVVLGVPADLVRRRPDVRRAERQAAAQAEQIGIAEADLYPAFSINGNFGYTARNFPDLFRPSAFNGSVGPSFQWNLLNYGRIVNEVRYQDAKFQELAVAYQSTVLRANKEVEDGLVQFLRAQRRAKLLDESAAAAERAVNIVVPQYKYGKVDFNRYATIEQNLVTQQDLAAQAHGEIAQGLIAVFRALGGGWEIRLNGPPAPGALTVVPLPQVQKTSPTEPAPAIPSPEEVPLPVPSTNSPPSPTAAQNTGQDRPPTQWVIRSSG